MASSLSPIVAPAGIQAGNPFIGNANGGDVLFVRQTNPAIAISTSLIHIDSTQTPPQVQIGPFAASLGVNQIPGATVIGAGAVGTPGGAGNIVVLGTNAKVNETQDSVAIGHAAVTGAVAASPGAVAVGPGATVGGAGANAGGGVAVGNGASANNGVAVGPNATCLLGQVAVGGGASVSNFGIAVGGAANAGFSRGKGSGAIAMGRNATAGESTDVVISSNCATGTGAGAGGNICVVGSASSNATITGQNNVLIGGGSGEASNNNDKNPNSGAQSNTILVGGGITAAHSQVIMIGRGATSTAVGQCIIGGTFLPVANVFFGNGAVAAAPQNVVVGVTGGDSSSNNIPGASLTIAGGISTGTAVGGSIVFQTTPAGGVSNTTPNALVTALTIDSTQTCTFANPQVVTNTAVGAPASKAGTLTNLPPAATAGDPQSYLTFKSGGHTYAIPAWQIA